MKILYSLVLLSVLLYSCNSNGSQHAGNTHSPNGENHAADTDNLEDHISFYESEQRHIWQKPNYVIELFGEPLSIKTIADIGASTGYFTFHSLPKVHKMIAVDIDSSMTKYMKRKAKDLPIQLREKLDIRLATKGNPQLKNNEVDGILMVSTYPYIEDRITYMSDLIKCLREDGKIIIIEFKDADFPNGPPDNERILHTTLTKELQEAGYRTQLDTTSLQYQYIVVATVNQ